MSGSPRGTSTFRNNNNEEPRTSSPPADAAISQADALSYWSEVPATVDGMLGGFPQVSRTDLQSSANFLTKLRKAHQRQQQQQQQQQQQSTGQQSMTARSSKSQLIRLSRAIDCGAGIGRITKGLLCNVADVVDILEPVEKFTLEISSGADFAELRQQGRIGNVFTAGMEEWEPPEGLHYDLIWTQWCLGQLNDAQLEQYFRRCSGCLSPAGWIVVKENMSTDPKGNDIFEEIDSSVTRADAKFRDIFKRAGLNIVATELQRGFPSGLYPVRMYALKVGTIWG